MSIALVSDPGYRQVRAAIESGVSVYPIPGPSATLAALSASGLPTDSFRFAGFLPHKPGQPSDVLSKLPSPSALTQACNFMGRVRWTLRRYRWRSFSL
jgi:16S rRNA (cytidine1402-2'-O)-methyltransferase